MTLANDWQKVSKRWGHAFHAMCSYMAMFPPRLPHYFIEKFTRPDDVVLDPFCGRGTTPLEACVAGRIGIGVDLNPLAYALTRAKLDPPPLPHLLARVRELENDLFYSETDDVPDQIRMLFHPKTLRQLVYLREVLEPAADSCDAFLAAVIMGVMHGASNQSAPSYLSISMPNTFSMSPNYIRTYVEKHGLKLKPIDVFGVLRRKLRALYRHEPPAAPGFAYCDSIDHLSRLPNPYLRKKQVKLVVSSPPYLRVVKYGLYNWIRLWFLNVDPTQLDKSLAIYPRLDNYLKFMQRALRRIWRVLTPGGVCCLVVGDVVSNKTDESLSLADEIWKMLQKTKSPFRLYDIVEDKLPERSKVSKIWGEKRGRATQVDRILVLYRDSIEELTDAVDWSPPKRRKAAAKV